MRIKSGVELNGTHPALWYAATAYDWLRQSYGLGEGTITSGTDGTHRVGSYHYQGLAMDFRSTDLADPEGLAAALRDTLAPLGWYDVIFEGDHIHVELSPAGLQAFGLSA